MEKPSFEQQKNFFFSKFFFSFALFALKFFQSPSKPEKKKFSKKSENWFGKTRGHSKTSCEDGFSKKCTVQEFWAKNGAKMATNGFLTMLAIFAQFFAHNSSTVHLFEKPSSQDVLEFSLVLPNQFSDFFENFFFRAQKAPKKFLMQKEQRKFFF